MLIINVPYILANIVYFRVISIKFLLKLGIYLFLTNFLRILFRLFILNSILEFYIKNQYSVELFFYMSNVFSIIFILKIYREYPNFKINFINFGRSYLLYFYL